MRLGSALSILFSVVLFAGCKSQPVPDLVYYTLEESDAAAFAATAPKFDRPIVVEPFMADGVRSEQAVLYRTDRSVGIRSYHYQAWNDSPTRLLQKRLIAHLRRAGIAATVVDRVSGKQPVMSVTGQVEHFERVQEGEAWFADVGVELRVDRDGTALPIVLKTYRAKIPAEGESMQAAVSAFTRAVDEIYGHFIVDLSGATE